MAEILLKSSVGTDVPAYRIFVDNIGSASISVVTVAPPAGVGLAVDSVTIDNTTTPKSVVVVVSGAPRHGGLFEIQGTITLSTGQVIVRSFTLRTHKL